MMKIDRDALKGLKFSDPAVLLATWFGVGLMKPAPGTWGTIAGVPFAIFIAVAFGWIGLFISTIALFFIGAWAAESFEKKSGSHDHGSIVIDEVVGVWIALWCMICKDALISLGHYGGGLQIDFSYSIEPLYVILAILFFRFFDILKPWPIGYLDKKIPGGLGVMVDDVVAGIFSGLCVIGIRYAGLG